MFERGFLYWAALDKKRPVLVVSTNALNQHASYVTVVPATTRIRHMIAHVLLRKGQGGADKPTMLLCEHCQTLHKGDLEPEPLGPRLPSAKMREVEDAILFVFGIER